ncbi:hypothetical protein MP228_010082 [Amoeboaphelidium protococcarum]|nr:hypothetical protein MP228_010082 [Amoeboaphelidium protococcarum]
MSSESVGGIRKDPDLVDNRIPLSDLKQTVNIGDNNINVQQSSQYQSPGQPLGEQKSYQIRALFRKTLSYQKRQTFVNVCCVCICPFMMVMICGVLVIVFKNLASSRAGGSIVASVRYCSNNAPFDANTSLPLQYTALQGLLSQESLKGQTLDVGYLQIKRGSQFAFSTYPCIFSFDNDYQSSPPYSSAERSRDTTFYPAPKDGWFNIKYNAQPGNSSQPVLSIPTSTTTNRTVPLFGANLLNFQYYPWNFIFSSDVDVGQKLQSQTINNITLLPANNTEGNKTGFLGGVETFYYVRNGSFVPTDYFVPAGSVESKNEFMLEYLRSSTGLYEQAYGASVVGRSGSSAQTPNTTAALLQLSTNLRNAYPALGSIVVEELNSERSFIKSVLQSGYVRRLSTATTFVPQAERIQPPKALRNVYQAAKMTDALMQASTSDSIRNSKISRSLRGMPQSILYDITALPLDISTAIGQQTFPYALSFLVPTFVLILVKEKEDRILIMMRMHGLSSLQYYLTHYLHFMTLQIGTSIVFIISGFIFQLSLFTQNEIGVLIVLLLVWANTMVLLSFLLSLLFNKSRPALQVSVAIVAVSAIISGFSTILFNYGDPPNAFYTWPFFGFFQALTFLGQAATSPFRQPYKMSDLTGNDPILTIIGILIAQAFAIVALTAYLNAILPSEFGVAKKWYFIFTEPYKYIQDYLKNKNAQKNVDEESTPMNARSDQFVLPEKDQKLLSETEDQAAKAERQKVLSLPMNAATYAQYPLIVKEIRKQYGTGKVANVSMCLAVEKGIVFGLLGSNGCGKSTLIHQLIGLYTPTSGTAYVCGFDILSQISKVYLNVGICPQHDILWPDLTCLEHILFYARLRGIDPSIELERAEQALADVELTEFRDKFVKTLSGGQKRRVSLAIALLDNGSDTGNVCFLDEPTTGLDPEIKAQCVDIIQKAKKNKTIILTTHNLDEVEVLSTRIGIMSKGMLKTIGTPLQLKSMYGKGYRMIVSFYKEQDRASIQSEVVLPKDEAKKTIESFLPPDFRVVDQGGVQTSIIYEFGQQSGGNIISKVIEEMDYRKLSLGVEDWGISQTSLEDVFLNLAKDEDIDNAKPVADKKWYRI